MSLPKAAQLRGFSLFEMLIAITVLGILLSVAILGNKDPAEALNLESSAREVAAAIRFAQSRALAENTGHGVEIDTATQRIRVFRMDDSVPPLLTPEFSVRHPVDLNLYSIPFQGKRFPATLQSASLVYGGTAAIGSVQYLDFLAGNGVPAKNNAGTISLLDSAQIVLEHGGQQITVSVAPRSGRVSLQ